MAVKRYIILSNWRRHSFLDTEFRDRVSRGKSIPKEIVSNRIEREEDEWNWKRRIYLSDR